MCVNYVMMFSSCLYTSHDAHDWKSSWHVSSIDIVYGNKGFLENLFAALGNCDIGKFYH